MSTDNFYVITTVKGKPKLIENYDNQKHADEAMEKLKKFDKRLSYSVVDVKELQKMKLDPRKDSDWAEITESKTPTRADMKWIMPEAIDAFWAVIEKHYKDFGISHSINDVSTEMKFSKAAEEAVTAWVKVNYIKESTQTDQSAFSIKSFETFLIEAGGETGWTVEVHKTDSKKARIVVTDILAKKGRDINETIPDFDKNYALLRKAVDSAWGVMRKDMPVINDNQIAQFQKMLKDGALDILKPFAHGHMLSDKEVQSLSNPSEFVHLGFIDGNKADDKLNARITTRAVKDLKPIQTQIFLDKTADMIASWGPATQGSPVTKLTLIISKEGYILDGHHRFSCAMLSDPNLKMSVLEVPMQIDKLLELTKSYGDALGNQRNG